MRFESRKGQNEEKWKKKNAFYNWKKRIFFTALFLHGSLALHLKYDSWSLRRCSYNILNHSKWRRIDKDLPKCSIIGRQSAMGWFTLHLQWKNTTRYINQTRWTSVLWGTITPSNRAGMVELGLPWKGL
jgi:hypothetical protein